MAEKKSGGYYKVAAGFTSAHGVAQEGQIVRAEDMVSGDAEFEAMSPEDQQEHFGRVLYEEYTPEEGDVIVGSTASGPPPPGDSPIVAEEDLVHDPREEESEAKPARSTRSSAATPTEERRAASEPRPTTEEHRRSRE